MLISILDAAGHYGPIMVLVILVAFIYGLIKHGVPWLQTLSTSVDSLATNVAVLDANLSAFNTRFVDHLDEEGQETARLDLKITDQGKAIARMIKSPCIAESLVPVCPSISAA